MSIDIDWQRLTTGLEGDALAGSIREWIHSRFQQVTLPRFIRSVEVHDFEFGNQAPEVEIKDVCDPLPDFYDESDDEDGEDADGEADTTQRSTSANGAVAFNQNGTDSRGDRYPTGFQPGLSNSHGSTAPQIPTPIPHLAPLQPTFGIVNHHLTSPILSRASTPGLPGDGPGWSYFMPRSGGLPGTPPLSALAGAPPQSYAHPWPRHAFATSVDGASGFAPPPSRDAADELYTRPSTATSAARGHSLARELSGDGISSPAPPRPAADDDTEPGMPRSLPEPDPEDVQIVLRVRYRGNVRLALTAAVLLDYPMPSFVELPLRLTVTGLQFDGVALLAYLGRRKGGRRAHFCFLGPEDAQTLVGRRSALDEDGDGKEDEEGGDGEEGDGDLGGLLREMKVESEIGQREGGKQVLKNVGKVEKFVLEQVRRIFEDEFVYPSFWTFLV